METVNVYWSNYSNLDRVTRQALYLDSFKPLLPELLKTKDEYASCKSLHSIFKNTFYIEHPADRHFIFDKNVGSDLNMYNGWVYLENPQINPKITFHYDLQWIFVAEEEIEIQQTPAYMHKISESQYGHIVAGSYDISKWIRPIGASYRLWDGVQEIYLKEGDPVMYINFATDKKVNLIRFEPTPKINEIISGATNLKEIKPNIPLSDLYRRFKDSKRMEIAMKEIKSNLLE